MCFLNAFALLLYVFVRTFEKAIESSRELASRRLEKVDEVEEVEKVGDGWRRLEKVPSSHY